MSCLARVSKGEQRLMQSVLYFRNPFSNCDLNEKVLKSLEEVGIAKSEKKLHPYFPEYLVVMSSLFDRVLTSYSIEF